MTANLLPDHAWLEPPDIFDGMGFWQASPSAGLVEYVRADLPALSAAAMKRTAAKALDERGQQEQVNFGLGRETQNFYRARDIVKALPDPSPADLLADAARVLLEKWDADTASGLVYGPNEFAVLLRAIAGEA